MNIQALHTPYIYSYIMDFCMSLHDDITSALGVKVSRPALYIYSIAGLQVDAVGGAGE